MCNESKPHARVWLMLVDPSLSNDMKTFLSIIGVRLNKEHCLESSRASNEEENNNLISLNPFDKKTSLLPKMEVPCLLRDPIATLLLIAVNLPLNVEKSVFSCVVSSIFNLVYIQSLLDLIKEFDDEEKEIWSNNSDRSNSMFKEYVGCIVNFLKFTSLLSSKETRNKQNSSNFYMVYFNWKIVN